MPEEPVTFDELERLVLRLTGNSVEALEQQMVSRLKEETLVGGKRVTRQELPELPEDAATTVHRVKVSLYGAKPPVWRRLEIPSAIALSRVHAVLQVAFDWHDYHLHAFETVCGQFGSPDHDDDWAERQDEATATLAQVAGAERAKVVYSYDFGDDWRHDIVVEMIVPAEPGAACSRLVNWSVYCFLPTWYRCRWSPSQPNSTWMTWCRSARVAAVGSRTRRQIGGRIELADYWAPQALGKAARAAKIWHLPDAAAAGLRRVWDVTGIACPAEPGAFVVQAGRRRYTAVTFRGDPRRHGVNEAQADRHH